jgi:hypothetical protein
MLYTDIWYSNYILIIMGFLKSCQPPNAKMIKIFSSPPGGSCEKIPLTPALSPESGGEGKGEGSI